MIGLSRPGDFARIAVLTAAAALLTPLTIGCGDDRSDTADGGTGFADSGTDDDGAADDGDAADDDGSMRYDVGAGGTGPGDESDEGCDKVDFLFVIDNSSSMIPAQESLVASFPGFIAAIQAYDKTEDFHVMVVDSDETLNQCESWCLAGQPLADEKCGDHICGTHKAQGACAQTLGAGIRYPVGGGASNIECGLPGDRVFMEATQPDVDDTFGCLAQVGNWGHWDEAPANAMIEALTTQSQPGGCNEGFLRDDAILVVTVVSNANDNTSTEHMVEDPADWFQEVVAAKSGDEKAIVAISFSAVGNGYYDKYAQFTQLFGDRGFEHSMGLPDYGPAFLDAVSTIMQTCDEFVPPEG